MKSFLFSCKHEDIGKENGYLVCRDCGLVIDEIILSEENTLFIVSNNSVKGNSFRQAISLGNTLTNRKNLGSLFNAKKDGGKYQRLEKINNHSSDKDHHAFGILSKMCKTLNIPRNIHEEAAYRFMKLQDEEIINKTSCICFCLWDAIRFHKHSLTFHELMDQFMLYGHHITGHLLTRDGALYSGRLRKKGVLKTLPKSAIDYFPRLFTSLKEMRKTIEKRIKLKKGLYSSVPSFLLELETLSKEVFIMLEGVLNSYSCNPYNQAAAIVYFSNKILGLRNGHSTILTQKIISTAFNITAGIIRETYYKIKLNELFEFNKEISKNKPLTKKKLNQPV